MGKIIEEAPGVVFVVMRDAMAAGHAFHLCKNFFVFCLFDLIFQCFLAVRVIESQFVGLARFPWLAKL